MHLRITRLTESGALQRPIFFIIEWSVIEVQDQSEARYQLSRKQIAYQIHPCLQLVIHTMMQMFFTASCSPFFVKAPSLNLRVTPALCAQLRHLCVDIVDFPRILMISGTKCCAAIALVPERQQLNAVRKEKRQR